MSAVRHLTMTSYALAFSRGLTAVAHAQETPLKAIYPAPIDCGRRAEAGWDDRYQPPKEGEEDKPFWTNVPPIRPFPRPGLFLIYPSGPGYYSFRDFLEDNYRDAPPKSPYPPTCITFGSFYDADFRYLDDPKNTQHDLFDPLKRIHLSDNWLLSFGGEERLRYMDDVNKRLTGKDSDYLLERTRVYGDLWYLDVFRIYVEYIDAHIFGNDLPPLAIDVDRSDILNLFIDVKAGELHDKPIYVRAGRQEMYYGSYRLIAASDWDNTRRTFEGVKVFWRDDKLSVDAFWVRPVVVDPSHLNSWDDNRSFAGLWTTYRPQKGQTIDLYYLYLDQTTPVVAPPSGGRRGFDVNTVGSRYSGDFHDFLWDVEGMFQFGDHAGQDTSAGAACTGIGYRFADSRMTPTFWLYNDWYSGDPNGGKGSNYHTFNPLFGFGHYYQGWTDVVGRQNIDDINMQFTVFPTKWISSSVQAHFFYLNDSKDALYSKQGVVERQDPTGHSGNHVGDEIDLINNIHLSQHEDLLFGYSHLFPGEFLQKTGFPGGVDFCYVQYSIKW